MTTDHRPLLALPVPEVGPRSTGSPNPGLRLKKPGAQRQGDRLSPQFNALAEAFDGQRARLSDGPVKELDPELVVVFDLAGSVKDFQNAVAKVEGLEFLAEYLDEDTDPDEDFFVEGDDGRVPHSLYLVMSNAAAVGQLLSLFERWTRNPQAKFDHGLGKFKSAFEQLRSVRRWDVSDRIRDTGLIDDWEQRLELAGQSYSPAAVEIELWFRHNGEQRAAAQAHVEQLIEAANGTVVSTSQIPQIGYHAILATISIQQVQSVVREGAGTIQLLSAEEIMFVSPYTPMSVSDPTIEPLRTPNLPGAPAGGRVEGKPRIALLDGLPFVNHDVLAGRLGVDDPDNLASGYGVMSRRHGTHMASLIIHGDLSNPGPALDRPLYVRPIMQPNDFGREQVLAKALFPDLVHRAIRRMYDGEGSQPATAPSVRIVNLSIGSSSRALVRRISPVGRLLDWLAVKYNVLFIVSAGNHPAMPITVPATCFENERDMRDEALRAARQTARYRGILPPGDALNCLTVGATHADAAGDIPIPDTVVDIVDPGMPALYGGVGPGVGRSIKPEIYHAGGRALYVRPPTGSHGDGDIDVPLAPTEQMGPGNLVAAPGRFGATDATMFTHGTSNATALVSREASRLFDVLESGPTELGDLPFPDPQYHPVLVKALLVHTGNWDRLASELRRILNLSAQNARKELTTLLGYGPLDPARLGLAATNRAVLVAAGSIGRDQRHTHRIPLPQSLHAQAQWRRLTVTLAYMAPTEGHLSRYRGAKIYTDIELNAAMGARAQADYRAVRRGSCQHEVIDGAKAMVIGRDSSLPVHVECMNDAKNLRKDDAIRYGLVVSVETAATTSTTIHHEIRTRLQAQARAQAPARVRF
ncbi:S8 family peptidase [Nocardia sp. NRRL WC-3656]|uniref:S8 family peptidase n=1 Tax=Nocardia sp. NRRL WC-3656 TaxID=1463824 RepID=UPI0004C308FA|nr:S8 family peptidase [Nocardia sp. NRRL WC-3656]